MTSSGVEVIIVVILPAKKGSYFQSANTILVQMHRDLPDPLEKA